MATMYCALCGRPVEARRQIGVGTVVLAFVTAGLSLLAIPFYARRCSICKSSAVSASGPNGTLFGGGATTVARISDLEQRLNRTAADLEAANLDNDRLRTERDFYRQLLGDPATRGKGPVSNE